VADSYEHDNAPSSSIKDEKRIGQLRHYQLFNKDYSSGVTGEAAPQLDAYSLGSVEVERHFNLEGDSCGI
jgi:hypothetical protein